MSAGVLKVALTAGMLALAPGCFGAAQPFPRLKGLPECGKTERKLPLCRVDEDLPAAAAREKLGGAEAVWWRDGDRFTVVARSSAPEVMLCCSIQTPMARLGESDLWTITVSSPRLDEAVIDVAIIGEQFKPVGHWRGERAPSPRAAAGKLIGVVTHQQVASSNLGASRSLTIYSPPARGGAEHGRRVAYVADGASIAGYAALIEPLILSGELPPVVLVGVHSAPGSQRNQEYLLKRPGGDFQRHEAFFLEEVVPIAEARFGASSDPQRRLLIGMSNGGDWALDTALRNPSMFRQAAVLSPSGASAPGLADAVDLRLFLAAGLFEQRNFELAQALQRQASRLREPPVFRAAVAGHSDLMWRDAFVDALMWAFPVRGLGPSGNGLR